MRAQRSGSAMFNQHSFKVNAPGAVIATQSATADEDDGFWNGMRTQLEEVNNVEDTDRIHACDNCGVEGKMERCPACRTAYFCSDACKKEYEPFHKRWCKSNHFADAVEKDEPEFASWLRKHGRQAVVRDADVARMQVRFCMSTAIVPWGAHRMPCARRASGWPNRGAPATCRCWYH